MSDDRYIIASISNNYARVPLSSILLITPLFAMILEHKPTHTVQNGFYLPSILSSYTLLHKKTAQVAPNFIKILITMQDDLRLLIKSHINPR